MPHFGPIRRKDFIRCLKELGFSGPYSGGRHEFMIRESDKLRLAIPNPHKGEIGKSLLAELLREAGITRGDWEKLK
ncbi:MAG: type II toxin-antitoxin system HicA family toxin [Anaerolineales bacterium]